MTIGTPADAAITNPAVDATAIALLKGILTDYRGETLTLAASAARAVADSGSGTAYPIPSRGVLAILLEFTDKQTDGTDTCDVYIDMLIGSTWVNAVHFTQALGNGTDAAKEYALIMPTSGLTTPTTITSDAASGVVRPEVIGSQIRARWAIVDGGGSAASFTFAVTAWAL